jgi:hypothetical protein
MRQQAHSVVPAPYTDGSTVGPITPIVPIVPIVPVQPVIPVDPITPISPLGAKYKGIAYVLRERLHSSSDRRYSFGYGRRRSWLGRCCPTEQQTRKDEHQRYGFREGSFQRLQFGPHRKSPTR